MKKIMSICTIPLLTIPSLVIVSCSKASPDYFKMPWALDAEKINTIKKGNWNSFNNEPLTIDKLKKVIKGDGSYIDPYTTNAFNEGWFKSIKFEVNSKNEPTRLAIELLDKKVVTVDGKDKDKKNPYRLPNGSLVYKY